MTSLELLAAAGELDDWELAGDDLDLEHDLAVEAALESRHWPEG